MAGARRSNKYLTNNTMLAQIIASKERFRTSNRELTVPEALTPDLVNMFRLLVERISKKSNWRGYSYIEDMKSDAHVALCQNAFKFNEERGSNPFAYFTTVVNNAFKSFLDKESKVRNLRDNILEINGQNPSYTRQSENERKAAIPPVAPKDVKKRAAEIEKLQKRLEAFDELLPIVTKLKESDPAIEKKVGKILGIGVGSYTSVQKDAIKCKPESYSISVDAEAVVLGTKCTMVTLAANDGKSKLQRVLTPPFPRYRIPIAIMILCMTAQRDIISRRLRELTGDKPSSMYITVPAKNAGAHVDPYRGRDLEYTESAGPWGGHFDKE